MEYNTYKIGDYIFDFKHNNITTPENLEIILSVAESKILKSLIENDGIIFSHDELTSIGWDNRPMSFSSLTVVITALRKKLSAINGIEIKNVPRKGYFLSISSSLIVTSINTTEHSTTLTNHAHLTLSNTSAGSKPTNSHNYYNFILMTFNAILIIIFSFFTITYALIHTEFKCKNATNKKICYVGTIDEHEELNNTKPGTIRLITKKNTAMLSDLHLEQVKE